MFMENEKNLLVGTTDGLLNYNGTWSAVSFTTGKRINAIHQGCQWRSMGCNQ